MKKPNSTARLKIGLRQAVRRKVGGEPLVVETHGGAGFLFSRCYSDLRRGYVLERDPKRTSHLARQRPTWSVLEGDSEAMIAGGALANVPARILDVDPYGDPWPVLRAFFREWRARGPIAVVVNDGLKQKARRRATYRDKTLAPLAGQWGGKLYEHYLEVAESLMRSTANDAGFEVTSFSGYHATIDISHYAAELVPA